MTLFCFLYILGNAQNSVKLGLIKKWYQIDSVYQIINEDKPAEALKLAMEQIELAKKINIDTLYINSLLKKGSIESILGVYDAALKDYYLALKNAEGIKSIPYQAHANDHIGRTYQSMNDLKQSIEYFKKAKLLYINSNLYVDSLLMNYEIGFNLIQLGDSISGFRLMKQNLDVALKKNIPNAIVYGLDNLSNVTANSGNYKEALSYQLELLKHQDAWNTNYKKTAVYEHFAEIYILLKDWVNAKKYLALTYQYARLINSNDWLYECYQLSSKINAAEGKYKEALEDHQKYTILKDSVYRKEYDTKMAAMSSLYDLDSKQKAIEVLVKDKLLKESKIKQQRSFNEFILISSFLILIIIVLVARYLNQKNTRILQEKFSRELLQSQEEERQRISKDLHDSVGQNILFIKNQLLKQSNNTDAKPLLNIIDNALEEVRNISKDLYPNQLEKYGLVAAIDALVEKINTNTDIFMSHDLQGIDDKLSKDIKINFYRIIQECVNNSLKHAQANIIRLTSERTDNKITFVVQDNGKGFDTAYLEKQAQYSFGLLNIEERIKLLKGKFELDSSNTKGTKLTFTIPV